MSVCVCVKFVFGITIVDTMWWTYGLMKMVSYATRFICHCTKYIMTINFIRNLRLAHFSIKLELLLFYSVQLTIVAVWTSPHKCTNFSWASFRWTCLLKNNFLVGIPMFFTDISREREKSARSDFIWDMAWNISLFSNKLDKPTQCFCIYVRILILIHVCMYTNRKNH